MCNLKQFKCIFALFTYIALLSVTNASEKEFTVSTKHGLIEGFADKSHNGKTITSFLGIPFAKPPIGARRFEDPVELEPWSGTLQAKEQPSVCMQYNMVQIFVTPDPPLTGDEDCLYLNVHTPKTSSSANLAVMVYIHGGGWVDGGAKAYSPHVLLDEDVVLVVIQYRLGVFGFLSTGDDVLPGNLGLKDQSFALKWIQENIAQFGGDSSRVTIFGESAGAASVHLHILSPLSKGLFHRAIMQSGTALCSWSTVTNQRDLAEEIATATKCPIEQEDYKDCLKKADSVTLMLSQINSYKYGMQPLLTSPTVDGEFLEEDPVVLVQKGKYNKVNTMVGMTRDEGAFMTACTFAGVKTMSSLKSNFDEAASYSLFFDTEHNGALLSKKAFDFYLNDKAFEVSPAEMTKMFTDRMFSVCHDITSTFLAMQEDIDLYRYEFLYRGEKSFVDIFKMDPEKKWVSHVDDLIYIFPLPFESLQISSEEDLKMRSIFVKLWTKFAKTGNPSHPSDNLGFVWPATTDTDLNYLGLELSSKMMNDSRQKIREFWLSLDTKQNKKLFPNGGFNLFEAKETRIRNEL